jgi:hypothetical protein
MPRNVTSQNGFDEPSCWGSGELPLLPGCIAGCKAFLPGVTTKANWKIALSDVAAADWSSVIGNFELADRSTTLLDAVVAAVDALFAESPNRIDIPILAVPLDRLDNADRIPLEIRSWRIISERLATNEVAHLLTGTFRDLIERLGDARAALDLAVTGAAWIGSDADGVNRFVAPRAPRTISEAQRLARMRGFRTRGMNPSSACYAPEYADVMGRRFGIAVHSEWTLARCAQQLGLTRERVRQLGQKSLWDHSPRHWGRPPVLEDMRSQLMISELNEVSMQSTGEVIPRSDAAALLVSFGYPVGEFDGPRTLETDLAQIGIKLSAVQQMVSQKSQHLGFISMGELKHHLADEYPKLVGETLKGVMTRLLVMTDLPYGYVQYVDGPRGSRFNNWLKRLISVLGQQTFEEAYAATERFCRMRIPRFVFPPRSVIAAYLERSEIFRYVDGTVSLESPSRHTLDGVEKWMYDTIMSCTGHVIHRTELGDRARQAGTKNGTLSVYTSYSLYFKPTGRGCVTVTGFAPSDAAVSLAGKRAAAIRVPTQRELFEVRDGVVRLKLQVGNVLLDTGNLATDAELRQLLEGQRFKALTSTGHQFGHISLSNSVMIGFVTILQYLQIQPGDIVELRFDLKVGTVEIVMPTS